MPGYRSIGLFLFVAFSACTTPEDTISHAQRRLLQVLQNHEYFEISAGPPSIKLILPPGPQEAEKNRKTLSEIESDLQKIDNQKLAAGFSREYRELLKVLQTIREKGITSGFNPVSCVLTRQLLEISGKNDEQQLRAFIAKIPEYYAEVEARWQPCLPAQAREAADQSLKTLDLLDSLQAPQDARLAVKDFIGLCNSARLDH